MLDKILSVSIFGAIGAVIGGLVQAPPPEEPPDEFEKARQEIQRRQKEPLDKEAFKRKLAAKQRGN